MNRRLAPLAILLVLSLGGCSGEDPANAAPARSGGENTRVEPAIRVRVALAEIRPLAGTTRVPGVVHPFQKATLATKVSGRVAERLVEPGDVVVKDTPLLRLDEVDLRLAADRSASAARMADVDLADARRELDRALELHEQKAISEAELDARRTHFERAIAGQESARVALAQARQALSDATLRAPFDGSVEVVDANVGEVLQPGVPVVTMVDFSRARVRAGVTAAEAAQITEGQSVDVGFDTLGGTHVLAEVRSVSRSPEPGSGTYAIEIWLDAPDSRLREGMIGEVTLERKPSGSHPVVPRQAVIRRDGRMTLFLVREQEGGWRAEQRSVRGGRNDGTSVEILDGAADGDLVVIDGHFALGDGALVSLDNEPG